MEKRSVVIYAEPVSNVVGFNMVLADYALKSGIPVIYIAIDRSPDEYMSISKNYGLSVHNSNKFVFVNGYYAFSGKSCEAMDHISNITNLEEFDMKVFSSFERLGSSPSLIIVDSFSTYYLHNKKELITKFYQLFNARVKNIYGSLVYIVYKGIQTKDFDSVLYSYADILIELKLSEKRGNVYRISKKIGYEMLQEWKGIKKFNEDDINTIFF